MEDTSLPQGFLFDDDDEEEEEEEENVHDQCNLAAASARTSCVSAASFPVWQISPEPSWTRSPLRVMASSSRPLLYHCMASLHHSEGNVFSVTITREFIFTGASSNRVRVWRQPDCAEMGFIKTTTGEIRAMLARGKLLFTVHGDRRVRAWEISKFPPKKVMTLPKRRSFFAYRKKSNHHHRHNQQHRDSITCLAYNSKEKLLFTGSWDHTVNVWRVLEKHCVDSFIAHESRVNAIAINQDDGCVFTCSSDGTVKIWRRVSRESAHMLTVVLKFQQSPINALALSLSPTTCFLYSGSSDGLINFWEKETTSGRYNHSGFLKGHHFAILCLETMDELILSGSEDSTIRIWRRDNANSFHSRLAVIEGHHGPVKCLAAAVESSGRGKALVVYSGSLDQTLKVWRVNVNEENDVEFEDKECNMSPVLSPSWVQRKVRDP